MHISITLVYYYNALKSIKTTYAPITMMCYAYPCATVHRKNNSEDNNTSISFWKMWRSVNHQNWWLIVRWHVSMGAFTVVPLLFICGSEAIYNVIPEMSDHRLSGYGALLSVQHILTETHTLEDKNINRIYFSNLAQNWQIHGFNYSRILVL